MNRRRAQPLIRLVVGLVALGLMAALFMSGWTPPGVAGEVIRHNQARGQDASALFYSELEQMPELEAAARIRFGGVGHD